MTPRKDECCSQVAVLNKMPHVRDDVQSSNWATSRGGAGDEFHTPEKRAGAGEHRAERLLDRLDGLLILIVTRKTVGP
jgi:hypothetical protein